MKSALITLSVIFGLPALVFVPAIFSTLGRMSDFERQIVPGTSVEELRRFAGAPTKIMRRGEPPAVATRSYKIPPLDEHMALYIYSKSSMPYYNVFVFIDERQNTVTECVVENLWW